MAVLRAAWLTAAAAAAAAAGLWGCAPDAPLLDLDYRGEPLFVFEGVVDDYRAAAGAAGELRMSVFWGRDDHLGVPLAELEEQASASVDVRFPDAFEVALFQRPETAPGRDWIAGLLRVYADADGDGRYGGRDTLVGGALVHGLVFVREALGGAASPTGRPLGEGFHLVPLPLPCVEQPFEPLRQDCGVPIGAACGADADCGGAGAGVCLRDDGTTELPGGYCTVVVAADALEPACRPEGGVELPIIDWEPVFAGGDLEVAGSYWGKPCQADGECRVDEGYACDPSLYACQPRVPVSLVIGDPDFVELLESAACL